MQRYIFLIWCLGTVFFANAQDWCNPQQRPREVMEGGFRIVGASVGCAPFAVTVEKTTGENPLYIFNYRGGNPTQGYTLETRTMATYPAQGSYRILQLISVGTASVDCKTVEVFATPNFTLQSCSGRRVQVNIANDSIAQRYEAFLIDWGLPGSTPTRVTKSSNMTASFVYPDLALRTVTVTGIYNGQNIACTSPSPRKNIVPSNTSLSAVRIRRVATRADGQVDVLIQGVTGINAELQMSTGGIGTFSNTGQVFNRSDTTTLTIRNVDALKNTYCFRLSANDGCDNNSTNNSNVVCSTNLTATPQNRQNLLEWSEYPNTPEFVAYSFKRNTISTKGISNRNIITDIDANVICGEQYCYQMTVALSSGAESVSPLRCVKAISDERPSVVSNPFVQVSENSDLIELYGNSPIAGATPLNYKMIVSRSTNGGAFSEIATLQNSVTFEDKNVDPTKNSYCYQLVYENTCGNRSEPTEPICSILLYSKSNTSIDWTAESPFVVPVTRYEIYPVDEQGIPTDFPVQVGGKTSFNPKLDDPTQQIFRYRIAAYGQNAGPSFSNFFTFKRNAQVYIPDAFSPNNDGINDNFAPAATLFVSSYQMSIYNRWGESLFQTTEATEGWNGTVNGQPAVEGVYVYRLFFTDSLGQKFVKVGTITLLR